jgi:hypothetical protein
VKKGREKKERTIALTRELVNNSHVSSDFIPMDAVEVDGESKITIKNI